MAKPKVEWIETRDMKITDLKPHPNNPNKGSVPDIAESLRQFGQYRTIVATKDNTILAGHHVVEAAKGLGMDTVRVDIINTDEKTATKILLADNRIAELGLGPDLELLLHDLEELEGDILGTGYSQDYIKLLEEAVMGPPETSGTPPAGDDASGYGSGDGLRRVTLMLGDKLAEHWEAHRKLFTDDSAALGYLLGGA